MKANEPGIILTFFWFSTTEQANTGRRTPVPAPLMSATIPMRGVLFLYMFCRLVISCHSCQRREPTASVAPRSAGGQIQGAV